MEAGRALAREGVIGAGGAIGVMSGCPASRASRGGDSGTAVVGWNQAPDASGSEV